MNGFQELKRELLQINEQISSVLLHVNALPVTVRNTMDEWGHICRSIDTQLSGEMFRIAVIGAIKSGKSTFINSFFSGDYLKRGAGVVTAMVTKIRRGEKLKANLEFKSVEEVNADIGRALALFPSMEWKSNPDPFDIRLEMDRRELQEALGLLGKKHLISNDTRNLNSLYLSYYLKGFDRVKPHLLSENPKLECFDQDFFTHREFSGNEVMAIYLKDISLEIPSDGIDKNIEIADCQGSDSPNPLHMAMIQDYLIVANFLIYVISSRTGIRQADINFLSMIKKMGLLDQMMFIINVDLSEHHNLDDLRQLVAKVYEDLSLIKKCPEIFAYSALFSLFRKQRDEIPLRDRDRLLQWERESELSSFSDDQETAFTTRLTDAVTTDRHALLLMNHLSRLKMIEEGLARSISLKQDFLSKGVEETARLLKKVKSQQKKVDRVKSLVKNTLDGSLIRIKQMIRAEIDRFFDPKTGEVVPNLIEFIRNYRVPTHKYQDVVSISGFKDTLYLVFQEFKHAVDTFMAEDINPRIFSFVKSQEDKIKIHFDSIIGPYDAMVKDAVSEYNSAMEGQSISLPEGFQHPMVQLELKTIKQENKLEFLPAAATMTYSVTLKTEAMMRLGFYNIIMKLKQLARKSVHQTSDDVHSAIRDAVLRMKKETEKSIIFHFKNYNENIKFQYIFKLVDLSSEHIYRLMMERFYDHSRDLSELMGLADAKKVDKELLSASLQEVEDRIRAISARMDAFQQKLAETIHSKFTG